MPTDLERRVADLTAELEAANQQLQSFAYSVSHDLRAPLRAIAGFSSALAEDCGRALGDVGRQHLERVQQGVRRMSEMIDGLLTLSRVMTAEFHRAPLDVSALAQEVARALRDTEPGRSAEVVIQPGLRAVADPTLTRALLTHLLGNAWKFTAKLDQARIELAQHADASGQTVFAVRDNGAGFDMQYAAAKLFVVFQRLHRQEDFPGTGVGLAVAQRIVLRHGGRIWGEGRPDEGATFFFTLP